jgi:hypothetical protein
VSRRGAPDLLTAPAGPGYTGATLTTKTDLLHTGPMIAGLTRTAASLRTYIEALNSAYKSTDLTPEMKAEILTAAHLLHDAQQRLKRAAKMLQDGEQTLRP